MKNSDINKIDSIIPNDFTTYLELCMEDIYNNQLYVKKIYKRHPQYIGFINQLVNRYEVMLRGFAEIYYIIWEGYYDDDFSDEFYENEIGRMLFDIDRDEETFDVMYSFIGDCSNYELEKMLQLYMKKIKSDDPLQYNALKKYIGNKPFELWYKPIAVKVLENKIELFHNQTIKIFQ